MEITPDKWQRAKAVFDAVLQQPAVERASFLAVACPEEDLREQVEQLRRLITPISAQFMRSGNTEAGHSSSCSIWRARPCSIVLRRNRSTRKLCWNWQFRC